MKKIYPYFLLLFLLLVSCETSEDVQADSAKISSQLAGSWELVEITAEEGRIGSATPTSPNYFEMLYHGEGTSLDVTMTFTDEPNALDIVGEGFLFERTITEHTDNVELNGDIINDQWTFAFDFLAPGYGWKVEQGKFIYDDKDGSLRVDYGAEIIELDETNLLLKMDYNNDFPKTGGRLGQETCTFYATFEKQ